MALMHTSTTSARPCRLYYLACSALIGNNIERRLLFSRNFLLDICHCVSVARLISRINSMYVFMYRDLKIMSLCSD